MHIILQDTANENYYQLGVLSNDTTQPVYYLSSTAIGLIVFDFYDDSAPPASIFEIPKSCKGVIPPERFEKKHRSSNVFNSKRRS